MESDVLAVAATALLATVFVSSAVGKLSDLSGFTDSLVALGLPVPESVTTDVRLVRNPLLSQCLVEAWLQEVTVGGSVSCGENPDDGCTAYCLADTGP